MPLGIRLYKELRKYNVANYLSLNQYKKSQDGVSIFLFWDYIAIKLSQLDIYRYPYSIARPSEISGIQKLVATK